MKKWCESGVLVSMFILASGVVGAQDLKLGAFGVVFKESGSDGVSGPFVRIVETRDGQGVVLREIRAIDFPLLDGDCEVMCAELPDTRPCHGRCVRGGPTLFASDADRMRVYFTVTTELGANSSIVIFSLAVPQGEVRRLTQTTGTKVMSPAVSPFGTYLSYLVPSDAPMRAPAQRGLEVLQVSSGHDVFSLAGLQYNEHTETLEFGEPVWDSDTELTVRATVRPLGELDGGVPPEPLRVITLRYSATQRRIIEQSAIPWTP